MVKSVNAPLALEWLIRRARPRVLLVRRHPLDVVASRVDLGFLDLAFGFVDERGVVPRVQRWQSPPRPTVPDAFRHLVWLAAFEMSAHEEIADAHPEFHVVSHETLCSDPTAQFRRLAAGLGLEWTDECDRQIRDSNVPGSGFDTKRVTGYGLGEMAQAPLRGTGRRRAGDPVRLPDRRPLPRPQTLTRTAGLTQDGHRGVSRAAAPAFL